MSAITFLTMLTSQADTVRGLTVNAHALAPIPTLIPGITTWVLPLSVLTDNYQQLRNSILATLTQTTLNTSQIFPVSTGSSFAAWPSSYSGIFTNCTYKSSWPIGQTIAVSTA